MDQKGRVDATWGPIARAPSEVLVLGTNEDGMEDVTSEPDSRNLGWVFWTGCLEGRGRNQDT